MGAAKDDDVYTLLIQVGRTEGDGLPDLIVSSLFQPTRLLSNDGSGQGFEPFVEVFAACPQVLLHGFRVVVETLGNGQGLKCRGMQKSLLDRKRSKTEKCLLTK